MCLIKNQASLRCYDLTFKEPQTKPPSLYWSIRYNLFDCDCHGQFPQTAAKEGYLYDITDGMFLNKKTEDLITSKYEII